MLSVVGGTVPVVTSGVVCGPACVSIAASNTSGCMPRTCGTRLGPGSPAAMYVCMYTYSTDAHACVRVCPRFLRPLTVVDEIREAPGRYVLTPCHSLSLAHPRCVCTAMVANQHTLMHVDGEDSTNQPHACGRIPRAASRTASRCTQRSTACVAGLPARTCHCAVLPYPLAQQAGSGAALPPPP